MVKLRLGWLAQNAGKRLHRALYVAIPCVASMLLVVLASATTAQAAGSVEEVSSLTIKNASDSGYTSTLELKFDKPVTKSEAEKYRAQYGAGATTQAGYSDHLACQQHVDHNDSNGFLTLQYVCYIDHAVTNWGFRLSAANQATLVGNVSEQGLSWWRNSAPQPRNAPHTVPANYLFHGTMNPMFNGDHIDYQDYFTWRHNIGPGGTASLAFAGSVNVG